MNLGIEIDGKKRAVDLSHRNGQLQYAIDGREAKADAVEIAPGIFSIVMGGKVFEARVETIAGRLRIQIAGEEYLVTVLDPRRWRRGNGASVEREGRQQVVAPMPGKIVRVLVKSGEKVEAGQGLVVVEAMKMQNEVRTRKAGKIERMLVEEGQTVNAGEILAVVA